MEKKKRTRTAEWGVFGINLLVKLTERPEVVADVHCPRGHGILYAAVVAHGDGFEPGANAFREMPPPGTLVCFEEFDEDVEGYYFYHDGQEYRVLEVDRVIMSFPPVE